MHVPPVTMYAVVPVTVQTPPESEAKLTVSPALDEALRPNDPPAE
jgi:hypothetical protein